MAAVQTEPKTLNARVIAQANQSMNFSRRLFNADLALLDDQSNPLPYLAEALPRLYSDNWKVFPDGTMETTYHLRPNLVWHDGTPHTADDYVFSWQVYATTELGQAGTVPIKLIDRIEAPDDLTVLIHWTEPYAAAGALQSLGSSSITGLPPLPRHILGPALESGADSLLNHPYWNRAYIGLGPYKLDRWEPGAFIEASAFDRHALGAPKIQHIKMLFLTDSGAALATMLSGDAQLAADSALNLTRAATLLRQWPDGKGTLVPYFNQWLAAHFQGRPDMVSPTALKDARVRQALAYAVDRPGINDAIYEGQNVISDSIFPPASELGRTADAAVTKYPFDPARSAQLIADAGFTKGPDGFYIGPNPEKFSLELRSNQIDETLRTAMANGWRQAGFDARETLIPQTQVSDLQVKSTYPGLAIQASSGGEIGIDTMGSASIPRPENQWRGAGIAFNGYSNPELDRLIAAFSTALDPADRGRTAADVVRLYSKEVPAISLFFPPAPWVFTSDLIGPKLRPASSNNSWNIYEWELR